MMRSALLGVFALLFVHQSLIAQNKVAIIDTLLNRLNQKNLFNGAIVVGERDSILLSKGYGYANFSSTTPFTPDIPTDGGAIAETLTATAILLLADQQKLSLLDSVQQYIPEYPYANTQIWNLLTHSTGGLQDYGYYFEKIPATYVLNTKAMLTLLNEQKPALLYPPDSNFSYDSPGLDIAAAIVERVSGESYQTFLSKNFFEPLKMQQSFIRPPLLNQWPGERIKAYTYENDVLELADIGDREGFYGGSNIWFSANDLYKWGKSFYHQPIVDESLIRIITSWVSIQGKLSALRLGGWYQGRNSNAHYFWGSVAGFYSFVYWDSQQQFTIAFVSNTNIPQWVRPQLTSALIDIMEGHREQPIVEPLAENVSEKQMQPMVGKYSIDGVGLVEIYLKENIPYLRAQSEMEYRILLVDGKTFYVPGLDPWISFQKRQGDKFQNLLWRTSYSESKGSRVEE
ncbi:serine hydrolase [Emticicia sp. BO119]|uniref:serine hydrolase domain-containing protein n=1 Tax=Emticicia sp. BO119 TaxID=2757768 RepID=UPI0015F0FFA4|nr:serine hydrolase domain-containing protein [Emticicia sp. BO119]MBA4849330.1 beta-lactamase family protein [Emticicia sp. BO119]